MFRRYGIFNFLLAILIFLLSFKNYEIWFKHDPGPLKKEESTRSEVKVETSYQVGSTKPSASPSSLIIISEKNIFHPERREFVLLNPEQPRPISRPQIQLQGVLITEEVQTVSLVLLGKSLAKGEKAIRTLNLGDQIGEYKITKILPDRIVLEAPGDVYEVLLYDLKSPKKRIEVRTPTRPSETPRTPPPPPKPGGQFPTPQPAAPQPAGGQIGEAPPPTNQPPLPSGPATMPRSFWPRERQIPLPEESAGGKD